MRGLSFSLLVVVSGIAFADDSVTPSQPSSPEQAIGLFQTSGRVLPLSAWKRAPGRRCRSCRRTRFCVGITRSYARTTVFCSFGLKATRVRRWRPAQLFLVDKIWHHEFQSLSVNQFDVQSDLNRDPNWRWQPRSAGVEYVDANDVDAPAGSPPVRLRQMKAIADRFSAAVDMNEDFSTPEQLRLLTTPIYRYSSKDHEILDGVIFAFVQGTNPEILLMIEALGNEPSARWRYGFARMSSYNLRVVRDQTMRLEERSSTRSHDGSGLDLSFPACSATGSLGRHQTSLNLRTRPIESHLHGVQAAIGELPRPGLAGRGPG